MMRNKKFFVFFLIGVVMLALPVASQAQVSVGVSVRIGPPPLPVYVQPVCPTPGYLWTPGYWAYGSDGYYWVPGTWVEPPSVGVLWTPGYWGWRNGFYVWNGGYWGPHVGFYGGINYGFGYTGVGFAGGVWRGGVFSYNRAVSNVNVTIIHNTYNTTVINSTRVDRVSFNGGAGGTRARETSIERNAARERHFEATNAQNHHERIASTDRAQLASFNGGKPPVAASPKPGVFRGQGVVAGNKNTNFEKVSRNNTTPQSGNGNAPRIASNTNSASTFANKSSGPNNGPDRMTHASSSASNSGKNYQTDARVRQNNPSENKAHDHGQTGGQHGHGNEPHSDKR